MKKFIIYVIFVFVIGFSSYFIYGYMQAEKYNGTAIPYIAQVLPELSSWDVERVTPCMVPEVIKTISPEDLKRLLMSLSQIGDLQSIGDATFKNESAGNSAKYPDSSVITYDIETQYSSGPVTVTLSLLDRDGQYQIYSFNFQSQALAPK